MKSRHQTTALLLLAAALPVSLVGCGKKGDDTSKKPPGIGEPGGAVPVQVASVTLGTIAQKVSVTGNIRALQDVQLSARANGRVIAVNAREGDFVKAGQIVVQQDAADLKANVRQAQANVASAVAKLSQAQTNYQIQITQARQGVLQAQAQVAAARQSLDKTRVGLRPLEKLQQQNSQILAKANLKNAQTNLERNQNLYKEGAIAKADLDQAQTNYDVTLQQYKNAQASAQLAAAGGRKEDIASAQAQLQQQQTALNIAISSQKQVSIRKDDILAAQAAIAQAKATLAFNQQQVNNASIRSSVSGIVAARETEPGQIAAPGTNLMRIVNVKTVYYEPTLSETDLGQAAIGAPVSVRADAIPGRAFIGKIKTVYPTTDANDRNFTLRVVISNPGNQLRPGMFARGQITTKIARNVPVVPTTAVIRAAPTGFASNTSSDTAITDTIATPASVIIVGANNTAMPRKVTLGITTMNTVQIKSGLREGEKIVVVGQVGLKKGDKLDVTNADKAAARSAQVP